MGAEREAKVLGLVAGQGDMPGIVAEEARSKGYKLYTAALEGMADGAEREYSHDFKSFNAGEVGAIIEYFRSNGITQTLCVGKIPKTALLDGMIKPDLKALGVLKQLADNRDDTIMDALASLFESEGIRLLGTMDFCPDLLTPEGVLTSGKPTSAELKDMEFGFLMAKEIGRLDIGQTVVVKDRAVMAVEAIEGTDEAILRGGRLAAGGAVVVKVSRPSQDMRFDVPVVGADTLKTMASVRARVLALEVGKSIIIDRAGFLDQAQGLGIAVVGIKG